MVHRADHYTVRLKFVEPLAVNRDMLRYRLKILICSVLDKKTFEGIRDLFGGV